MRRVSIAPMLASLLVCGAPANAVGPAVPELPRLGAGYWLNSPPLTLAGLRLGIRYPVLIDNAYAYWHALDNRYWPAFYLIDAHGRLVDSRIGELHAGERRADAFEAAIAALLGSDR